MLVMRTDVQEMIVLMVAVFALMMKLNYMAAMKRNLMMMTMKIPLHMVEGLTGIVITNVLILKIGEIIVDVVIMMTRIILLVSS
jgi:uncharacterized protein YllA (UPF0747 family)